LAGSAIHPRPEGRGFSRILVKVMFGTANLAIDKATGNLTDSESEYKRMK
jgi:hypothetical protein